MPRVTLTCHPAAPSAGSYVVRVEPTFAESGELTLAFDVRGDVHRLSIPEPAAPLRADRLWEHTCFEAFIGTTGSAYFELNCSPSGAWNVYRFDDYRAGMRPAEVAAPTVSVVPHRDGLEVRTSLAIDTLAELRGARALALGPCVVLEEAGGHRSFWAAEHHAARPDFHVRAALVVRTERRVREESR